jgi:hypothetical protein
MFNCLKAPTSPVEKARQRQPWRIPGEGRDFYDELLREALIPVEMDDETSSEIEPDDRHYVVSSSTATPSTTWSSIISVNMNTEVNAVDQEPTVMELYETPRQGCDWHTVEALNMAFQEQTTSPLDILWRLEVRERAPRRRTQSSGERWGWLTGAYDWSACQELRASLIYSSITNPVTYLSFSLMNELSIFPTINSDIHVTADSFAQRVYRSWL